MSGFSMSEVGSKTQARHRLRGGFPPSFLARTEADSLAWRKSFVQTFLERALRAFIAVIAFLNMLY